MDVEQRHTAAMGDNKDKLISNILKIIEEFSLDGITFDYEYPHKLKSYIVYKSFLSHSSRTSTRLYPRANC